MMMIVPFTALLYHGDAKYLWYSFATYWVHFRVRILTGDEIKRRLCLTIEFLRDRQEDEGNKIFFYEIMQQLLKYV